MLAPRRVQAEDIDLLKPIDLLPGTEMCRWMSMLQKGTDFSACKWPLPLDSLTDSLARHFDDLNELNLQGFPPVPQADCQVITFSHFLPR